MENLNQLVNNEETELTKLTPSSRFCHIALRVKDCIVVTAGIRACLCTMFSCTCTWTCLPLNEVWVYNLYTDQWNKYITPPHNETPKNVAYGKGVVIGGDIYLLCSGKPNGEYTHTLWILRNPLAKSAVCWEKVRIESQDQQPSPRRGHGCWAYDGKLWIFGGEGLDNNGDPTDVYNNELLSFDPATKTWCKQECSGDIPSPQAYFGSDIMDDKVWLFGGWNASECDRYYLYTLHMETEPYVWTRILTGSPAGPKFITSTFTADNNALVLNDVSEKESGYVQETWIIDLPSCSWRLHSRSHEMRGSHGSCKGLNNDIIVTGGYIFKRHVNKPTGEDSLFHVKGKFVQHIVPQPKSLEQLALKAVYTHRNVLPWKEPHNLTQHLITMVQEQVD